MTRRLMIALFVVLPFWACEADGGGDVEGTDGGGTSDAGAELAPESLEGLALTVVENGDPPVEDTWIIAAGEGNDGQAMNPNIGSAPFTYTKNSGASSLFTVNTGVEEEYDMTWTSETAGVFEYRFEPGAEAIPGSFSVEDAE